jgi:PKD repeat protein
MMNYLKEVEMKKSLVIFCVIVISSSFLWCETIGHWTKIKEAADLPYVANMYTDVMYDFSSALYDPISNCAYMGYADTPSNVKGLWKYNLNTNQFTEYQITNFPPDDCNAASLDMVNNRIIMMDVHDQSTYTIPITGGALTPLGGGMLGWQMFGRSHFQNPFTNNPVILNGYGYGAVRNGVYEYDIASSTWITKFPDRSDQPWRRASSSITTNTNKTKVFMSGGFAKQSGSQGGSQDTGYLPWATDLGFWNWQRDLWQLDLSNWQWTSLVGPNSPSITSEGTICYCDATNSLYFIGGYIPSPVLGNNPTYVGGVYQFRLGIDSGFNPIQVSGQIPTTTTNPNCAEGSAIYDAINNRIVFFRYDGIWSLDITDGYYINFQASVTTGTAPLTTNFTVTSTLEPQSILSWDFQNDGIVDSHELSPSFIYTQTGSYSVKLIIEHGTEVDSLIKLNYITINSTPSITVTPTQVDLHVGYNQADSTIITITNAGLATLNWNITDTQTIPTNGLVAYYPLDGSTEDTSGNGNNGTNYGAVPAPDRLGNPNKAYYFNGIDNYIFNSSNLGIGGGDVTISAWCKPTTLSSANPYNSRGIVSKYDNATHVDYRITQTSELLGVGRHRPGMCYDGIDFQPIQANIWYYVALTYSASSQTLSMYVNGLLVSSRYASNATGGWEYETGIFIGKGGASMWAYFGGCIDDVRIYNRVLSDTEITSIYSFNNDSMVVVNPESGTLLSSTQSFVNISSSSTNHDTGYYTNPLIVHTNDPLNPTVPITVNIDFTPPPIVTGLTNNDALTDGNQIAFSWNAPAVIDSVEHFKIFRRGKHDASWSLLTTISANETQYIDRQFTGLDSTWVYYEIKAVDGFGIESLPSDSLMATLKRFVAPTNLTIQNLNNWHARLQWNPVTQTISGTPGTPTCYIIYKSSRAYPLSDFNFLGISTTNEFIHTGALWFTPGNKLFYVVTAYGGDLPWLRQTISQRSDWKYGELGKNLHNTVNSLLK